MPIPRSRTERPASAANAARNARAERDRRRRWAPARDAAWALLEPLLAPAGDRRPRIAVVGAGNGDTLPLGRMAARASRVALVDLDRRAIATARRRVPRPLRSRVQPVVHDVTAGAADAIAGGARPPFPAEPEPLPGAPFDIVVGDLLYSQLLYPALVDLGRSEEEIRRIQVATARPLVELVVARLHRSAPDGVVVHVHDPIAWWDGHPQPVSLREILAADVDEALRLIARGTGPRRWDPRPVVERLGHEIHGTALWHWPFKDGVDYLVCATVAAGRNR